MSITFQSLEDLASEVIAIMKTVPEIASTCIAIIGGFAIWKHFRTYRTTNVGCLYSVRS